MKHSSLPWHLFGEYTATVNDLAGNVVCYSVCDNDASFIVHCVNLHDELVAACKAAHQRLTEIFHGHGEHADNPVPKLLSDVIQKAEAK